MLGRLHDGHMLDMFEFGVVQPGSGARYAKLAGSKSCVAFVGDWDAHDATKRCKNW